MEQEDTNHDAGIRKLMTTKEKLVFALDTAVYGTVLYTTHCAGVYADTYIHNTLGKGYFRSFPSYNLDIGSVGGTILGNHLANWAVKNMHIFGDPIAHSAAKLSYTICSVIKYRTEKMIIDTSGYITNKINKTQEQIEGFGKQKAT